MAIDAPQAAKRGATRRHQLKMDRQKIFADDMKPGIGQKMVNVRDPSGDRVLDRDHRQHRRAVGDGREGVLEAGARQRRHQRIGVAAGDVGIGARLPLIGDEFGHASPSHSLESFRFRLNRKDSRFLYFVVLSGAKPASTFAKALSRPGAPRRGRAPYPPTALLCPAGRRRCACRPPARAIVLVARVSPAAKPAG